MYTDEEWRSILWSLLHWFLETDDGYHKKRADGWVICKGTIQLDLECSSKPSKWQIDAFGRKKEEGFQLWSFLKEPKERNRKKEESY